MQFRKFPVKSFFEVLFFSGEISSHPPRRKIFVFDAVIGGYKTVNFSIQPFSLCAGLRIGREVMPYISKSRKM
jgi:hypothetical protein